MYAAISLMQVVSTLLCKIIFKNPQNISPVRHCDAIFFSRWVSIKELNRSTQKLLREMISLKFRQLV
jgi:hypothetical protein